MCPTKEIPGLKYKIWGMIGVYFHMYSCGITSGIFNNKLPKTHKMFM